VLPHRSKGAFHLTRRTSQPRSLPAFTKGVFLGEIREDLVFPFPALDADERESLRMIVDRSAMAADNVDSKQLDPTGKFPDACGPAWVTSGLMGSTSRGVRGIRASSKGSAGCSRDRLGRSRVVRVLRSAPEHRVQGHHALGTEDRNSVASGLCGEKGHDHRRVLPHGARIRIRCAGNDVVGGWLSADGSHYVPRDERSDLERRLRRSGHGVREVPVKQADGNNEAARHPLLVDAHRAGASPSASPSRRWHQGERHPHGDVDNVKVPVRIASAR